MINEWKLIVVNCNDSCSMRYERMLHNEDIMWLSVISLCLSVSPSSLTLYLTPPPLLSFCLSLPFHSPSLCYPYLFPFFSKSLTDIIKNAVINKRLKKMTTTSKQLIRLLVIGHNNIFSCCTKYNGSQPLLAPWTLFTICPNIIHSSSLPPPFF